MNTSAPDLSRARARRVQLAREVLGFARNASDDALAAACRTLRRDGDPTDFARAETTLRALGRHDVLPPPGHAPGET